MPKGKVKFFNEDKGFGFIDDGSPKGLFVHINNIVGKTALENGQEVEFEKNPNGKKGAEAVKVKPIGQGKAAGPSSSAASSDRFYNPYNFVRWSSPAQEGTEFSRKAPESHLSQKGISGVIKCELTTETPLFISGNKVKGGPDGHEEYEFFKKDGQYTIPGSSLRGMIRSLYEAVTNSSFSILNENDEDIPLFYRGETRMAKDLVPARVIKEEDGFKVELLTGHVTKRSNSNLMYAAWLPKYGWKATGATSYHKRPLPKVHGSIKHRDEVYALLSGDIKHERKGFYIRSVLEISKDKNALSQPDKAIKGWYYQSGKNMFNKHDERFFYRIEEGINEKDLKFAELTKELPESAVRKYDQLIANYQEVNEEKIKEAKKFSNQDKISRHLFDSIGLKEGELLYVELDSNEKVVDVYPVMMSRKQYQTSVLSILPSHLQKPESFNDLCPATRLFGWIKGDGNSNPGETTAYKSRISVSDAVLNKEAFQGTIKQTLGILGTPKPTAVPMYLRSNEEKAGSQKGKYIKKGYDDEEVTIRGRKMYLSHSKLNNEQAVPSKFNRTVKDALVKGNKFTFEIKVENISEVELGAFLWCLQLEENMHHRLGYGKPFGFGQVTLQVDVFQENTIANRYLSWNHNIQEVTPVQLEKYITSFKAEMERSFTQNFYDLPQVTDLVAILTPKANRFPIEYPKSFNSDKNFEWFVKNKKATKANMYFNQVLPFPGDEKDYLTKN